MVELTDTDICAVIRAERKDERERCAKLAEQVANNSNSRSEISLAMMIAALIRDSES